MDQSLTRQLSWPLYAKGLLGLFILLCPSCLPTKPKESAKAVIGSPPAPRVDRPLLPISYRDAASSALEAWLNGDFAEASHLLKRAYLTNPDPEEKYDARFAHALALMGQADKTLARLQRMETNNGLTLPVLRTKQGRLLDILGRHREAKQMVNTGHHPHLALRLAIEAEDWDTAAACLNRLYPKPENLETKRVALGALMGEKSPAPDQLKELPPLLALLHGKALWDKDLECMALDSELWARKEALLSPAIEEGKPLEARVMGEYLRHLDLLPERERALQNAVRLGSMERCVLHGRDQEPYAGSAHKVIAAEALLLHGRGRQAYEVMRPLMEKSRQPHAFGHVSAGAAGGQTTTVKAAYQQATRIAEMEWPDLEAAQRIDRLAAILGQEDVTARAKDMLALIAKHEKDLDGPDLARALCLPMMDLGNSPAAPEITKELRQKALAMLAKRKVAKNFVRMVEWASHPRRWERETTHRPIRGKPKVTVVVIPEQDEPVAFLQANIPMEGPDHEPLREKFSVLNGLAEASQRHKKGSQREVDRLLRNLVIRLLLDDKLHGQKTEWMIDIYGSRGTVGSRSKAGGLLTTLRYFSRMDLPTSSTLPLAAACAGADTRYPDEERLLQAARVHYKAGQLEQSLAYHRLYLLHVMPHRSVSDLGEFGRTEIAEMRRVHAMIAAKDSDRKKARAAILLLLELTPYEPHLANDLSVIVKQTWSDAERKQLRDTLDSYWQGRLAEIPDSRTYRHWRQRWLDAFQ